MKMLYPRYRASGSLRSTARTDHLHVKAAKLFHVVIPPERDVALPARLAHEQLPQDILLILLDPHTHGKFHVPNSGGMRRDSVIGRNKCSRCC